MGLSPCECNVDGVKQWLSAEVQPWLMVIDNADDTSVDIARFFPAANTGSILITSRNEETSSFANSGYLEIGPFSTQDAISLLLEATKCHSRNDKEARRLALSVVNDLGDLSAFEKSFPHRLV